MNDGKTCTKCKKELPLSEFKQYKRPSGKVVYRADCNECKRAVGREYGKFRKDKTKASLAAKKWRATESGKAFKLNERIKDRQKAIDKKQGACCPVLFRRCSTCGTAKMYRLYKTTNYVHKTSALDCCRVGRGKTYTDSVCTKCGVSHRAKHAKAMCVDCKRKVKNTHKSNYKSALERARKAGVEYERVKRNVVFKRDMFKCYTCGCDVVMSKTWRPDMATIDHVIPISKGGGHTYANIKTMCSICNSKKSNKDVYVFMSEAQQAQGRAASVSP